MKTLIINDLSRTEELSGKAMAGVHGGWYEGYLPYYAPFADGSKHDFSLDVQQSNSQSQVINNNNGVNVAFAQGISSTIQPTMAASNSLIA